MSEETSIMDGGAAPDTECAVARVAHPPLWSRVLKVGLAVGLLTGLAEICWLYRINDIDPEWRAALPSTIGGLSLFLAIAVITDTAVVLLAALGGGCMLAVWRDIFAGASAARDRRFAVTWLTMTAALTFLWIGWLGLYILPPTDRGTWSYRLIAGVGVLAVAALSAVVTWLLNRLRRLHARMPAVCWLVTATALILLILPAYSRQGEFEANAAAIPLGDEGPRPNVLLITLDTLRYDYVGCNGLLPWIRTPHLDALAAEGLRFDQAISQSPTTTPSHCSIMTSVYPTVHGGMNGKPMRRESTTLAECLRENGYETIAFTSATTTRSVNSGLDKGFERYVDSLVAWSEIFSRDEFQNLLVFYMLGISQDSQIRGDVVTRRALSWLSTREDIPFFCWLHYFDPHHPYAPPPPYDAMYTNIIAPDTPMRSERELYAGEVSYVDAQVGQVIANLKQRGLYDETLIVVTSDHGEGFGEQHWGYTERGHGEHLYDTTQHVPLIVKPPMSERTPRGRRVRRQVELIDIAPTVLGFLGIPKPDSFTGRSLAPLLVGERPPDENRAAHAMTEVKAESTSDPKKESLFVLKLAHRTPQWKYVVVDHFNQEELYDLETDPGETANVAKVLPDLCAERMQAVRALKPATWDIHRDPRARLAPALRKQLEALGYLGGSKDPAPTADEED